jgi:hypothetical protein
MAQAHVFRRRRSCSRSKNTKHAAGPADRQPPKRRDRRADLVVIDNGDSLEPLIFIGGQLPRTLENVNLRPFIGTETPMFARTFDHRLRGLRRHSSTIQLSAQILLLSAMLVDDARLS